MEIEKGVEAIEAEILKDEALPMEPSEAPIRRNSLTITIKTFRENFVADNVKIVVTTDSNSISTDRPTFSISSKTKRTRSVFGFAKNNHCIVKKRNPIVKRKNH